MNKKQLEILAALADYGYAECPWAWSMYFKWSREDADDAVKAASQFLESLDYNVPDSTEISVP